MNFPRVEGTHLVFFYEIEMYFKDKRRDWHIHIEISISFIYYNVNSTESKAYFFMINTKSFLLFLVFS